MEEETEVEVAVTVVAEEMAVVEVVVEVMVGGVWWGRTEDGVQKIMKKLRSA